MIYIKLIPGWVAQHYDDETGDCVQQEFLADEASPVQRQNAEGEDMPAEQVGELENTEKECPTDMVQP